MDAADGPINACELWTCTENIHLLVQMKRCNFEIIYTHFKIWPKQKKLCKKSTQD